MCVCVCSRARVRVWVCNLQKADTCKFQNFRRTGFLVAKIIEEEEGKEEDLFVFNETIKGPRAPAVKAGRVAQEEEEEEEGEEELWTLSSCVE